MINEEYRKNIDLIETNYFFVGGFDPEKREGQIKLYKIHFKKKACDTTIEFLQDILNNEQNSNPLQDFSYDDKKKKSLGSFDDPISCIIQSEITGNIIVGSYSGNVYLFTPPNLEYYDLIEKKRN